MGQAIIQTDYYASAAKRGGVIPTVFHLTNGQWKMVVPGIDLIKLPLFYATKYYNRFCKGNILKSELETEASIRNYVGATDKFDPVGAHVFARDDAFCILLCSRDFENDLTVQLNFPDDLQLTAPEKAMIYTITGDGFSSKESVVDSMEITDFPGRICLIQSYICQNSRVDLSALKPGIYYLRIAKNNEVHIRSFIRE